MTGLEVHKLLDKRINTWNMSVCVCATARKVIFEAELKSVVQFLKLQKHKQQLVNQSFFLFFFTFFWPRSVFQRFFHVFGEDSCGIPGTKQCLPGDTAGVAGLDLPPDVPDGAFGWELDWGNQRFQVNEWVEYSLYNPSVTAEGGWKRPELAMEVFFLRRSCKNGAECGSNFDHHTTMWIGIKQDFLSPWPSWFLCWRLVKTRRPFCWRFQTAGSQAEKKHAEIIQPNISNEEIWFL